MKIRFKTNWFTKKNNKIKHNVKNSIKKINLDTFDFKDFFISKGNLIGMFIVILIGVSLLPTIAEQVNIASNQTNSSETIKLMQTIPFFFAIAILFIAISLVINQLRNSGVI